jgi:hypothetical protein
MLLPLQAATNHRSPTPERGWRALAATAPK